MLRLPPRGILRPNAYARRRGLSFAQAFQNGPSSPFVARGAVATAQYHVTATDPELYATPGGIGLTADGWGGDSSGNTYALSQTAGTVLMYLTQWVDGGGTARRWFTQFGPAGDNQHRMEVVNGNLSFGWLAGGVNRLIEASAVGYYTAGVPFTIAATWNAGGQAAYASGRQFGTGSAGYADTAGSNISIGYLPGFGFEAGRIKPSALLYAIVLDEALSADEIAEVERDPWWWVERPTRRVVRSGAALAPFSADISHAIALDGGASAAVAVAASAAGAVALSGSAAAALAVAASGASVAPLAANAALALSFAATHASTVPAAGIAAGTVALSASVAGGLAVAGAASGTMTFAAAAAGTIGLAGAAFGAIAVSASIGATIIITTAATIMDGAPPIAWPDWVPPGRRVAIGADVRRVSIGSDRRGVSIPRDRRGMPIPD